MSIQHVAPRTEVAFVNGNLADLPSLLAGLRPGIEVVMLDPSADGLAQVEAALAGRTGIAAVHLLGHGAPGVMQLGSTMLNTSLLKSNPALLANIGATLAEDGDILLYGCATGQGEAGAEFLRTLAGATGADVAASDDATGGLVQADWILEQQVGEVQVASALEGSAYQHTLALNAGEVHNYSQNTWAFSSLAQDASGNVYLAHKIDASSISIKKWTGAGWTEITKLTTAMTGDTTFSDDLALKVDADGNLDLLFRHAKNVTSSIDSMRGVKFGEYNITSGTWTTKVVEQASHPSGWYNYDDPTLTIGANGQLHTVYKFNDASVHDYYIKYATSTDGGATWTTSTVLQTTIAGIDELHQPNVLVDSAGNVHLFYVREDNQNDTYGNLYYTTKAAGSNTWSAPLKIASALESMFAVTTDGNGKFYVGLNEHTYDGNGNATSSILKVLSNATGSWATETVPGPAGRDNYIGAMQVADGKLHLLISSSAMDWSDMNYMVMRKDGATWVEGYQGEARLPSLSEQGSSYFGEGAFIVTPGGGIVVVTEDGNLRNIDYTAGTSADFGLISNAAPTVAGLDGDSSQFTPGATDLPADLAYIDLQVTGLDQVTVTDDSADFDGGALTITQTSGTENGRFVLDHTSAEVGVGPDSGNLDGTLAAGQKVFVLSGSSWVEVGRVHATLDGQDGRDLVIEFSGGSANAAAAELLVKWMMYTAPTAGARGFSLTLSDGDGATSTAASFGMTGVDIVPPEVTGVTTSSGNGPWNVGDTISIQVKFSEAVNVTGTPVLTLETGATDRSASYASGSGTDTLTFTYTVQAGDLSSDLDFTATTALSGGAIADLAGVDAIRTLAAPGAAGSLAASGQIVVDGVAPTDISLSNAAVTTLAGTHAQVGLLSTSDSTPSDSFTYSLVAGAGDSGNAAFEIDGATLRVIDASTLSAGATSVRVRTTDAAGNAYEEVLSITVTTPPTVAISAGGSNSATVNGSGTVLVTFTFSTAPAGFTAGDVTVTGGTLGEVSVDPLDSKKYTAVFTPTAGVQALNASLSVGAGKFVDAGNLANIASTDNLAITGDTLAPTVAISSGQTNFKAGQSATVVFTFSEVPAGFSADDVTVTGGSIGPVSATADSKVFTATFTPAADIENLAGSISVAGATFTDAAGNGNAASTVNLAISGDTLRPVVSDAQLDISGGSGANGAFITGDTVTVTWNDGATGDNNGDTAAATVDFSQYGGPSAVAATLSGGVWTATYVITAGAIDAGNRNVTVTVTDDAGNTGARTDSANASVDNVAPVVSQGALSLSGATGANGAFRIGDVVTASWNPVQDGTADAANVVFDFSQFGGGTVAAVFSGGVWSASYTVTESGLSGGSVNVGVSVWDDAGNLGTQTGSANAQLDALRATVTGISSSSAAGRYKVGDVISIQVTFSEAVSVSGTPVLALETGATDRVAAYASGSGTDTLTFTYTVQAGDLSGDLDVTGSAALSGGTIIDLAGNAALLALPAPGAAGSLGANEAIVVDGVAPSDIAISNAAITTLDGVNATVGTLSSTDGTAGDSFSYSLVAGAGDSDNAAFEIVGALLRARDPGMLTEGIKTVRVRTVDAAGNTYEEALAIEVSTPPTVAISSDKTTLAANGTATITFTFSDAPTGFDLGDVTVSGGALGNLSVDPLDPKVYTATFTPDAGVQALAAAISIDAGQFTDAGGLANLASTVNVAIGGDTLVPTLAITSSQSSFKAGETALITFTFSEAPAGFDAGDVSVSGGTLGALTASAGGTVYTATFTPAADIASLAAAISVAGGTYADAGGNAGAAGGPLSLGGDTLRPVASDASIVLAGATGSGGAFRAGDTVSVSWNDGASGDNNGDTVSVSVDFSQFGGPAAVVATLQDGVWSASYQLPAGALDAVNRNVTLTVTDDAGNVTVQADSANATVDNQAPAVTDGALTIAGATGNGGVYRIGDVVSASWDPAAGGNADVAGVTFDFSQFGGGVAAATLIGGVWTASYTITGGVLEAVNRNVAVTVQDDAGNSTSLTDSASVQVDARAPSVSISSDRTSFKVGDTATIVFTFSEAPANFAIGDITVTGGALSSLAVTADSKVYTATFTPTHGVASLAGAISVAGATFTDAAGNANAASTVNVAVGGDTLAPVVTDARVTLSGATGTDGAFRSGDTVTVQWNDSGSGDNNGDTVAVAVDFSQFGGPAGIAATLQNGVWSASYQIAPGVIDAAGRHVALSVTDDAGNVSTLADGAGATVDNRELGITTGAISLAGATGAGGVFRIGDVVTASWDDSAAGDGNGDVAGVVFDFSQFGGGSVAATLSGGVWSASYTITDLGADLTGRTVSLTAVDDAGNAAGRTGNATVRVDALRPQPVSISVAGSPASNAGAVDFTVVFSEAVTGLDAADFLLATTGAVSGAVASVTGSGDTWTVRVSGISGEGSLQLNLRDALTGVADLAGNALAGGAAGATHAVKFNAAPVFAGAAALAVDVAERQTAVATLSASDADGDAVSYRISGGADAALFEIDANGALRFKASHVLAQPADSDADNRYQVQVSADDGKGGTGVQDVTVTLLSDLDGDGTADVADSDNDNDGRPNSAEDPVPGAFGGNGDGNGDGVADSQQLNVASLATVVAGAPFATLEVADGLTLTAVSSAPAPGGVPRNVKLPLGVLDFTIGNVTPGATVVMSIYVDASKGVNGYFKQDNTGKWSNIATSVTTVGSKTKITFSLTDGGIFDNDGVVNGSISDPGGVALIAPLITSNGGAGSVRIALPEMTREVTTVSASTLGTASYSITGGADAALFEIDAATGALRFIGSPDFARPQDAGADNHYEVQVSATDAFGRDTQAIVVAVTDVVVVDGVSVETDTRTNEDGSTSQVVVVPVVVESRDETVGNNEVADIPLVSTGGAPVLSAQVPTGVGLEVSGSGAPSTVADSITNLIREIRGVTEAGSHDQQQMTGGGSGFLAGLPTDANLLVQTVVPTAAPGAAAAGPLVIQGAAPTANGPLSALVINASNLPSGSEIQLNDVAFAAIVGEVRVTGGAGAQTVWGDGQQQYLVLGADNDLLHGGAGNDTVGSAGGDDIIFGDEGDDLVFGGSGNDSVDGGTGVDVVQLAGSGRGDYSVRFDRGQMVLTHRDGGADGRDTVSNVEVLRFTGGSADTSAAGTIGRLYEAVLGRAADAAGVDAWLAALQRGATLDDVAQHMLASEEGLRQNSADADFVAALYRNALGREVDGGGLAYWTGALAHGVITRAALALSVVDSAEKLAQPVVHEVAFGATDAGTLVRMYDALYGRTPDELGINHWLSLSEAGVSMSDIADGFVNAPEALALYGAMDNAQFVSALYQVALHRDGTAAEVALWTTQLDEGRMDRGDVLLQFADSAEKVALVGTISTTLDVGGYF